MMIGDRWRRLRICIDPMKHVETQKAIDVMKRGNNESCKKL